MALRDWSIPGGRSVTVESLGHKLVIGTILGTFTNRNVQGGRSVIKTSLVGGSVFLIFLT